MIYFHHMTNFHPFRCNLCKKSHSRVRIDTEKDQILTKSKSALRFGVFFWETSRKVFKGEKCSKEKSHGEQEAPNKDEKIYLP